MTGEQFTLVRTWPWILIGLSAFHGLAEEMVWRGYVFRRLSEGRNFWTAGFWTMPSAAASHLPILLTSGPIVAMGALAVAAVTSIHSVVFTSSDAAPSGLPPSSTPR